jgi:hypothetical protein
MGLEPTAGRRGESALQPDDNRVERARRARNSLAGVALFEVQ